MFTPARTLALTVLATLALTASAHAVSPVLTEVSHDGLHVTATLWALGAEDATVYISKEPDRATDGRFLSENSAGIDFLTAEEIASGAWMHEDALDPGDYFVMLRVSTYSCPEGTDCMDGFSDVMMVTIPKPLRKFRVSVSSGYSASFKFTITPQGEPVPYKLCWTRRGQSRKCQRSTVSGYDWNRSASDTIYLTADDLKLSQGQGTTKATWYVGGQSKVSRTVRVTQS